MVESTNCLICYSGESERDERYKCIRTLYTRNGIQYYDYECTLCGIYTLTIVTAQMLLDRKSEFTKTSRAAISHLFKQRTLNQELNLIEYRQEIESLFNNAKLPGHLKQLNTVLLYIGDLVNDSGESLPSLPLDMHSTVGSIDRFALVSLVEELIDLELLKCKHISSDTWDEYDDISLTPKGWEKYENLKNAENSNYDEISVNQTEKTQMNGAKKYGFVAMQYGDEELETLIKNTVKLVGTNVNCEIFDLREKSKAGIIDNILRDVIREATFLIADLTHDNSGAYWEAGFAEGLKIPVIYICKKEKFNKESTHFDTNHCTTIFWNDPNDKKFQRELTDTLVRTLDENL